MYELNIHTNIVRIIFLRQFFEFPIYYINIATHIYIASFLLFIACACNRLVLFNLQIKTGWFQASTAPPSV